MANLSLGIALASLAVAFVALIVAGYGIRKANRATSAAMLVTFNEGFRQAWGRYFDASENKKQFELAELLNLFEIACAIYLEKSLTGNSRELVFEYLDSILKILITNKEVSEQVRRELIQSKTTFKFIKKFIDEKPPGLSVTIPTEWYQH